MVIKLSGRWLLSNTKRNKWSKRMLLTLASEMTILTIIWSINEVVSGILFYFLTNLVLPFYQRVARTSMNGLLRTCKLLLPNTITTTVEVRQHQKRPLLTQIKIKRLSIPNIINNKKNKRNRRVAIPLMLLQTWNQKWTTPKELRSENRRLRQIPLLKN